MSWLLQDADTITFERNRADQSDAEPKAEAELEQAALSDVDVRPNTVWHLYQACSV